jgi:acetyl-CoA carboxylase carboxyl transferase subunit alpha
MAGELTFELPLIELRAKIDELRKFGSEKNIDFTDEITQLEQRYAILEVELYENLTAAHC